MLNALRKLLRGVLMILSPGKLLRRVFGSRNDSVIKGTLPQVESINALEPEFEVLSDAKLYAKTAEFKGRLKNGETLDDLLPEAFAVAREAAKRTIGQRPFDVQMLGGIVLHSGAIAEMMTGEGKTLAGRSITMWSPRFLRRASSRWRLIRTRMGWPLRIVPAPKRSTLWRARNPPSTAPSIICSRYKALRPSLALPKLRHRPSWSLLLRSRRLPPSR